MSTQIMNVLFFLFIHLLVVDLHANFDFNAKVHTPNTPLYENPQLKSKIIQTIKLGTLLQAQSDPIQDAQGYLWLNVKIGPRLEGFILAKQLTFIEKKSDVTSSDKDTSQPTLLQSPWKIAVQGTGIFDRRFQQRLVYGGEKEILWCDPFELHHDLKNIFSLAGAVLSISQNKFFAVTTIIHGFHKTRLQPELRLRFALQDNKPNTYWAGANLGIQYAFSIGCRNYFASYLEIGAMKLLTKSHFLAWGATGIRLYF